MIRKKIDTILEWTLGVILAIMVLDVIWQIVSRYVIGSPSIFTDELASFLLIWLGILGGAYVYGKGEHLAINLLVEKCSEKGARRMRLIGEVAIFLFALTVMIIGGIWMMWSRFMLGIESAALEVNLGYIYGVLPISGALICYYSLDNLKGTLRRD